MISWCTKKCPSYKVTRKLGVLLYSENTFLDFRKSYTRLQLETYLDLCFAIALGMQSIWDSD